MTRKLNAADMFDTLEVDLWGNAYKLREITRSVGEKLQEAQKASNELDEDSSPDDAAKALIAVVDVILDPQGDDAPDAADVLGDLWDKDQLGLDWLTAFSESLQEEAAMRRRPTSATRTRR